MMMTYRTPLKSIRLKCLDCATTNSAVKNCEFTDCFLYPLRFGKNLPKGTSRLKAIRKYCVLWCMNGQRNEVASCTITNCSLYPFRLGKNPKLSGKRSKQSKTSSKHVLEFERRVAGR